MQMCILARVIVSDSFVIADWSDPGTHPGRPIAGLHMHRSDDEAWIVLAGRLAFRVGDEERDLAAGDSLLVPRGTPHSYWNPRAEPARYLLVMTPRIHRLIEALHAGDRTDFGRIFEEYDSELLA
jgi:mannose-6-phosphate isomerase-like protein (cupin superfamily)